MAEQNYAGHKPAVSSETGIHDESGSQGKRKSTRVSVTGGVWDDATQRLRTLKEDTDEYVRKNPTKAVFTALGIGFVLALMRRR